jgi:hypothetical protein
MGGHSKEDARRLEWATLNLERGVVGGGGETTGYGNASLKPAIGLVRLFSACMVSGGIQYGWALQLSLLSPYSQARVPACPASVISSLFFDVCFARRYIYAIWLVNFLR